MRRLCLFDATTKSTSEKLVFVLLVFQILSPGFAWIASDSRLPNSKLTWRDSHPTTPARTSHLASTPFEADLYDNPFNENTNKPSTAVPKDTKLVLGVNKYSHDTTICAADASSGQVLFAVAKERLSRKKHDAGNAATAVEACLEALDLDLDSIEHVVVNNHHHRVLPREVNVRHMEWECGLSINGGVEDGYDDPENLLPDARHHELSHHLAHAYSTAAQAPFDKGLCVVMDGMGEPLRTMLRAQETKDETYTSDFSFGFDTFQCVPSNVIEQSQLSYFDWREAESVYVFEKKERTIDLRPVWKRFTPEHSPPSLYNHGFENMDSVGALYSRASSHIFGDWNACGKVMGLAPWALHEWTDSRGAKLAPVVHNSPILQGKLYEDDGLHIDRNLLEGQPHISRNDPDIFNDDGTRRKRYDFDDNADKETLLDVDENDEYGENREETTKVEERIPIRVALDAIALASRMQIDLETVVMDFVAHMKAQTGETNLCLAGGVALNSVLNGRLARELGFAQTFISPYPGDDGIAVGCCAFGLFGNDRLDQIASTKARSGPPRPAVWSQPLSPYLGPDASEAAIKAAIETAAPWLEVESIRNVDQRLQKMAEEVESGGVVAWYHSRSELGPRALGHRSILADPRKKGLVRFVNEKVKSRESFRPFAPSVLAEEASNWFDLGPSVLPDDQNVSPFMSMTAIVHESKRARIPAVTHVDGSSRLQTVTSTAEPLYHLFISKFFALTGIPMILNTSFNTLPSEPIVESPRDAIRSFLYSMGAIEMLVMGDYVIKRKPPNLRKLLGEVSKSGEMQVEPGCPIRAGPATFESSFALEAGVQAEEEIETVTRVRMPDRPTFSEKKAWFPLLDDLEGELLSVCDGTNTMNDIMVQYTPLPEGQDKMGNEDVEEAQTLLQNIVYRLVRLYEHTLISW
jgi:carbamoyltransferase